MDELSCAAKEGHPPIRSGEARNLPPRAVDLDGIASANQATFNASARQSRDGVDFQHQCKGSICDRIWLDSNGNDAQDTEAGIDGGTGYLLDGANGYTLSDLTMCNGSVRVVASLLPSYQIPTCDVEGIATPSITALFYPDCGQNKTDLDFGNQGAGWVGDCLWLDTDGDGVQGAGAVRISGATKQLFDGGNNQIATAAAVGGIYNLVGGADTVKIGPSTLPAGVVQSYHPSGIAIASRAAFTLNGPVRYAGFGNRGTSSVGDWAWIDTDAKGFLGTGEASVNDIIEQRLNRANNAVAASSANCHGTYAFNRLLGYNYSVHVNASSQPVTIAPKWDLAIARVAVSTSRTYVDFGYWDRSANGVQEKGKHGVDGVTAQPFRRAGSLKAGLAEVASTQSIMVSSARSSSGAGSVLAASLTSRRSRNRISQKHYTLASIHGCQLPCVNLCGTRDAHLFSNYFIVTEEATNGTLVSRSTYSSTFAHARCMAIRQYRW